MSAALAIQPPSGNGGFGGSGFMAPLVNTLAMTAPEARRDWLDAQAVQRRTKSYWDAVAEQIHRRNYRHVTQLSVIRNPQPGIGHNGGPALDG